jgi:hypothetical protein
MIAAAGLVPSLFTRSTPAASSAPVALRPETRAVPRKEGSC